MCHLIPRGCAECIFLAGVPKWWNTPMSIDTKWAYPKWSVWKKSYSPIWTMVSWFSPAGLTEIIPGDVSLVSYSSRVKLPGIIAKFGKENFHVSPRSAFRAKCVIWEGFVHFRKWRPSAITSSAAILKRRDTKFFELRSKEKMCRFGRTFRFSDPPRNKGAGAVRARQSTEKKTKSGRTITVRTVRRENF